MTLNYLLIFSICSSLKDVKKSLYPSVFAFATNSVDDVDDVDDESIELPIVYLLIIIIYFVLFNFFTIYVK